MDFNRKKFEKQLSKGGVVRCKKEYYTFAMAIAKRFNNGDTGGRADIIKPNFTLIFY
jgi:hypothetical protein